MSPAVLTTQISFQNIDSNEEISPTPFAGLLGLWQERHGPAGLPARRDFTFEDLRPWLTSLFVVEAASAVRGARFALAGGQICQAFGCELTGCEIGDPRLGRFGVALAAELVRVAYDRRPLMTWALPSLTERPTHAFKCLFLPLADDGVTVDRLLGAYCRA